LNTPKIASRSCTSTKKQGSAFSEKQKAKLLRTGQFCPIFRFFCFQSWLNAEPCKEGYKTERDLIAHGVFKLLQDAFSTRRISKNTVFQICLDEGKSQLVTGTCKLRSLQRKQEAKQKASEQRKRSLRSRYSELFGVKFRPNGLDGISTCHEVMQHLLKTFPHFD
jgi:hypothetical protein